MKPFSILLIRLLAMYLVLSTLYAYIPILISDAPDEVVSIETINDFKVLFITSIVVPIIAGIFLWFMAGKIATGIHSSDESTEPINDDGLVSAGLFLIGFYLLIQHIGIIAANYKVIGDINFGSIFVIFISICLILGNDFFTKIYRKIKYFDSNT